MAKRKGEAEWMNMKNAVLWLVLAVSIIPVTFAYCEAPKRKCAPPPAVDGFYYPDCFVRVKALPGAYFPERLNGTGADTYVMYD